MATTIPSFALSEIIIGKKVGLGGFSKVCSVDGIELNELFDISEVASDARSNFAASTTEKQYVIKKIRSDLPEEECVKGIVDLAIEASFLSTLCHSNIISLRALSNSDPHEAKFFVVLDRLITTLERTFNRWRKEVGENSGYWFGPFGYCCAKEPCLYQTWYERLKASRDIANAIYYLHSNNIVYRDLKPDNIGFDSNGVLKLFDFGLAKVLDRTKKSDAGLYHLTGNTGSLRYMAPEVAKGEMYNQSVDAYSFGILFWQICSLQTPFAGMSSNTHAKNVIQRGERPTPDRSWPFCWIDLMQRSWQPDKLKRPEFDEIAAFMDQQIDQMQGGDGEIPSRTTEIKAKKKNKPTLNCRLDVDTRISTNDDGPNVKKFDQEVV